MEEKFRTTALLWAIGLIYLGYFLLLCAGALFTSALSCLGSCSEITVGERGEAFVMGVFFLVALFVLPKLVRGVSWARIVYIVLGLAFISNTLFNFYTVGFSSLKNTLLGPIFWIFNLPFILGSIYLLFIEFSRTWEVDLKNILSAILISSCIVGLQVWNIYNQHITLKATYDTQRIDQSSDSVKKVAAGEVYKDPQFNFEITFPWKVIVISDPPKEIVPYPTTIYISRFIENPQGPNSTMFKEDEFDIIVDRHSSKSQFDQTYQFFVQQMKGSSLQQNTTYARGEFNSLPYFKRYTDFGYGRGGSAEYYILDNTTLFEISFGGANIKQYEEIMKSFTLVK
jgi:hypothetical protein